MRIHFRFRLWYLPFLGIVIGIVYAYGLVTGLIEPWRRIGNPSEKISKIIGTVGWKLYIQTESGDIYSITYQNYAYNFNYHSVVWNKEINPIVRSEPVREYYTNYISPPAPFRMKQLYEQTVPASAESVWLAKFALSEWGNLWMWHYSMGGLAVFGFLIFPLRGLVYGSVLAILIKIALSYGGKFSRR